MFNKTIIYLCLFSIAIRWVVSMDFMYPTYTDHECKRSCNGEYKPKICKYNFTVEWYATLSKACYNCPNNITDCYRPDCVAANGVERTIIVVNRMLPGPSIEVCEGDVVVVNVHNDLHLAEGTSIHWHGIMQKNQAYMDGVGMLTQCPINPHTTFQYRFVVWDHGTHLWHAHSGIQRGDGVFGAFIVRQNNSRNLHSDKYDYDLSDHVIILNDWLNDTFIEKFVGHYHDDGDNKPASILINGRGIYYEYQKNISGRAETPRATFTVKKGFRYRFRLINAGILFCPITFHIDNHNLTVIATDGREIEPVVVETIVIMAGERYDFILNADQDVKNYWIKTKGLGDCSVFSVFQTAILNYEGEILTTLPISNSFNYTTIDNSSAKLLNPLNTKITPENNNTFTSVDQLRSLNNTKNYNGTVDKKFYLSIEFNKINNPEYNNENLYPITASVNNKIYTPQINHISMMMPPAPALYQWKDIPANLVCNDTHKNDICSPNASYCYCIYTLQVNLNDLVELVIVDEAFTFQSNHPMHLHGHPFAVIGVDRINQSVTTDFIKSLDDSGLLKRNLDRPPIKDTVTVPAGGYTILRFIADNPGVWMFHCHLELHAETGMALVFKVGQEKDYPKEPYGWQKCGSYQFDDRYLDMLNRGPTIFTNYYSIKTMFLCSIIITFITRLI